jgi:hypothetical protein
MAETEKATSGGGMSETEALPPAAEPPYLTEVLCRCGVLGDGRVSGASVASSRATILSRIVRLQLTYDGEAGAAPRSAILKTGLPERIGPQHRSGSQEVAFYRDIASAMPPGMVPRCFDGHWDAETHAWHLLLEDLTDTHFVAESWPQPPTFEENRKIVAARARFHAAWWDDQRLGDSIGAWPEGSSERFAGIYAGFAEQQGERLSPQRRDVYQRLIDRAHLLNARIRTHRDMTIVQGDSHVWNAFLPRDAGSDDVRLFDWDCWRVDVATDDLAYMMALQWFPDQRRRWEHPLLDLYHAVLAASGVTGYDRRALDDDYRLSVLWQIATPVWQAVHDIPRYVWCFNLERIFMAVDDLDCRELLA